MQQQIAFVDRWVWLFPLTYLAHIAEEYWGGFYRWIAHITGAEMSAKAFLNLNAIFLLVMTVSIVLVVWSRSLDWLIVALGTIVLINGSAHTLGSVITRSYSPGVVSGLCLWIPLGGWTLRRARRCLTRTEFYAGMFAGAAIHGLVFVLALNATRS